MGERISLAFVLQNSRYREVITNFAREQGYRANVTRDEMESILKQCKDAKLIPRGAHTASLLNCWVEEDEEEEEEEVESPKRQRDEEDEEDDVSRVVLMCAAVYPMAKSEGNLKLARKCYERAADLLESYFDKQNAEDDEDEDFIGSDEQEKEEEEAKPPRVAVEPMFVTVGARFNMLHPGVDAEDRLIEVGAKALRYYIDTYNEMPKKKRGSGSYNYPLSRCAETVDRAIREVMQD